VTGNQKAQAASLVLIAAIAAAWWLALHGQPA
jgi:hypothetical protein